MHRSRLYGILVDAPLAEADGSVEFWAAALGAVPISQGDQYTTIGHSTDLTFVVQAVDDKPRYHVDIETDDVEAETARLIGLGAVEVARPPGWVVLQAPGGHLLCVVAIQSEPAVFAEHAKAW